MIRHLALLIFGWKRTPDRFVARGEQMILAYLKDLEAEHADDISPACLTALSRLAFDRGRKGEDRNPRFIYFVRELERITVSLAVALEGRQIRDDRVRALLALHGFRDWQPSDRDSLIGPPNQPLVPTPGNASPSDGARHSGAAHL